MNEGTDMAENEDVDDTKTLLEKCGPFFYCYGR